MIPKEIGKDWFMKRAVNEGADLSGYVVNANTTESFGGKGRKVCKLLPGAAATYRLSVFFSLLISFTYLNKK